MKKSSAFTDFSQILDFVLEASVARGATGADAQIARGRGVSVDVREGALEHIERSETQGLSLRCFHGKRQANVSGSDISPHGISELVSRCVAMAKAAPEDEYCGLVPSYELAKGNVNIDFSGDDEWSADNLKSAALEAEAAAMGVAGVSTVSDCGAGWSMSESWVGTSNGFRAHRCGASSGIGLAAVAKDENGMERDYDSWTTRRGVDRPSPATIGKTAATRALSRLGSRKIDSQTAPVIYDRRVSSGLVRAFLGAISGPSVARGVSYLKDRMDEQIFSKNINIIDDPYREFALGNRRHDGEGRAVQRSNLIENGMLHFWLLNSASAKQLNLDPNGFASGGFGNPPGVGTSNVYMEAGDVSPEQMMRDVGRGLLVSNMFGPSINPNTGDYSVGVSGHWFEDGEIAHAVSEVTIASNLPDMFKTLIPASDLVLKSTNDAPSLLIPEMQIAGN